MRRRAFQFLGAALAGLMLSVATLPWWLGVALRWAGPARGLTFSQYERIGYSRFALHDAEYRHPAVRVTAARIEADTPLVAWWRHGEIQIARWLVDVPARPGSTAPSTAPGGWLPLRLILERVATSLGRWAPAVALQAGAVRWPGAELTCTSARWNRDTLSVQDLAWRNLQVQASLAFTPGSLRLQLCHEHFGLNGEDRAGHVAGDVSWRDQHASLQARFGARGWRPEEATLQATQWTVPAADFRLGESYTAVHGNGEITWRASQLAADLALRGAPRSGALAPPLELTVRGRGDSTAFTVEELQAILPGIFVRLNGPVTLARNGQIRGRGAFFTFAADLAQQPWFPAAGKVTGELALKADVGVNPPVDFQLAARDVSVADWSAALVEAHGQFEWPTVRIATGTLTGSSGEHLRWSGGWNFATHEVLGCTAAGSLRQATLARWLPASLRGEELRFALEASGPIAQLRHAGRLESERVVYSTLNPIDLTFAWSGSGRDIESFAASGRAGATQLVASGSADASALQLDHLALTVGGVPRLQLVDSVKVRWRPTLQFERLRLVGPDAAVEAALAWAPQGRVDLVARNLPSAWLDDLGCWRGPAGQLRSLAAHGAWDNGPMTWSLTGAAEVAWPKGPSASFALAAVADFQGVELTDLSIVENKKSAIRAVGRIPLQIFPFERPRLEFRAAGPLELSITTDPNATLWRQLAAWTGLELQQPDATVQLTGTWAAPQGKMQLLAARVSADPAKFPALMPTVEALALTIVGDLNGLRTERATARIEGQAVSAQARLSLAGGTWRELVDHPREAVQRALEAHVELPAVELAALTRFLPAFLAPRGRLQADVTYLHGSLRGSLRLQDAATRPLGPLGGWQEITAEVRCTDRLLVLQSVTAQSGGQTVTLSGSIGLPPPVPKSGAPGGPSASIAQSLRFDLTLRGNNLPLVRQTGALVRGDLDLTLTSPARGGPLLAGTVRLHDSLFLADLRALLAGGTRSNARPAPYFAVETAPYSTWRLNVGLQGERFLRLRTALFNGVASARLALGGTLGAPTARGEATINEGEIKLPFATFAVQEGRVSLAPESDSEPQVRIVGTARRLNHDLRLEATGPVSAPVLVFSASPPLESGQVLLLVMTGEAPSTGVTYTDRQRMARLGTYLGQSLALSLSGESDAGERLSLAAGENVSRQGRETYGIEYRLNDRWSLTGEYDEFDEFNAGVKWRVFSRGGTEEKGKK